MTDCRCDLDGPHERVCDYCAYEWDDSQCPHDTYQKPCPECSVVPAVQQPQRHAV